MSGDHDYPISDRRERYAGAVFTVASELVTMPNGDKVWRDRVETPGASAVVAIDDEDRIVLIRQYRNSVRRYLWELPAGIADVPGESSLDVARRELAEEVDLAAARWELLVDVHPTPGYSNELIHVFLARDLTPAGDDPHPREHEEADLTVRRVPLDDAVDMVLRGEITNGADAVAVLAAARARDLDWAPLRPAQSGDLG